ncbi:uncharacterized protein Z520_03010 [Fonsecaea multimorphosa CBS 102226]|uniref:Ribokinase n=1 Tax=Fonsecaea multimorphosa CBS 102226 TaxID=1442371 RepID=A0A0D2K6K0_9EURO|nr:uncharacterized protein Z520_03010 [Fonsecaea multimorphosa CBS 102226]KIY01458.1 hypothetical protein Z520_03010 [Fonsecaea multimorphosa CBS 102226]OAL28223.1 hypothetical protein AYO22_02929 [Fonsecaea multimorphosa]
MAPEDDLIIENNSRSKVPHICVVGSINIDFVTYASRIPGPGETLTARAFSTWAGGKGLNQAVACARASFNFLAQPDMLVNLIGTVGAEDHFYDTLVKPICDGCRVSTVHVNRRCSGQTGSASIIVDESSAGQNRILVVPGVNHSGMSDATQICDAIARQKVECDVVLLQGEIPRSTVLKLLCVLNDPSCRRHVIFNPAPVFPDGIPPTSLKGTAVLVMNETEAGQIASFMLTAPRNGSSSPLNEQDFAGQLHKLLHVKIVLITLGARGVFFSTCSGLQGRCPARAVRQVVDTTAAGDTFVGYFASGFAKFMATGATIESFDAKIESVIQDATMAAGLCVERPGASQSIPFAYEIADHAVCTPETDGRAALIDGRK